MEPTVTPGPLPPSSNESDLERSRPLDGVYRYAYNSPVPRNDQRPITWSEHALQRLVDRGVTQAEAEQIIRSGVWHADGVGDQGDPKWAAEGSATGKHLRIVFVETTDHQGKKVVEVLHVVTVIIRVNRRR